LLVGLAAALCEDPIRHTLVNARRVLDHLGFDLILQVNACYLGQAQQVDCLIRQFFSKIFTTLAPRVECFGNLPLEQAEL
jgi:hypothetical protein